jgi:enoyl-CoA hydratase
MEFKEIGYDVHGRIRLITFNRPGVHNCIGPRMSAELFQAWEAFAQDDDAFVAIITGAGGEAFSTGGDLKAGLELLPHSPDEIEAHNQGRRGGILGPSRRTDIYKPIIAAINGRAYAGGLEWACFADIRIAEQHATFGVTCRRWNIGLADGGTQRLPRIIGLGRALELIMTGRVIDAREAYAIGLVTEIVPSGKALERAMSLAERIAQLPQEAIRSDKEAVIRGAGQPLQEGLKIEAQCFNRLVNSELLREGLRQFTERDHPDRKPDTRPITPGLQRGSR